MEYRNIAYVNKSVSNIIFGCGNPAIMQRWQGRKLLDAALDAGINTFDTAEVYGGSETALGKWVRSRRNRDKIVLITKGCHPRSGSRVNAAALKEDLEQSFQKLKTDYIDIYLLHRDDPQADFRPILEVLNQYHENGRIGAFGGSNWSHERIAEVNQYAKEQSMTPFSVSSPSFGLASQIGDPWGGGCVSISGKEQISAQKWYAENKMPVLAYSCLGGGLFSGKVKTDDLENTKDCLGNYAIRGYWCQENVDRLGRVERIAKEKGCSVAQIALAWTMQQKVEAFPIVNISHKDRIQENIEAVDLKLSDSELREIAGYAE